MQGRQVVASNPTSQSAVSQRRQRTVTWLFRSIWPLPGAITGSAVGFHLYFQQPGLNTDTFAPAIFAVFWAANGMVIGALITGLAAWLIERGVRWIFPDKPFVTGSIGTLCAVGLCLGASAPLEARLPDLLWPTHTEEPVQPSPPACAQTPPTADRERQMWDQECS
jgi:hypothetical protein